MSDEQYSLDTNRLPLLRAAALKNIEICVVDLENGRESPFSLQGTEPGCYLNIRWKAPSSTQMAPHSTFQRFSYPGEGIRQFTKIKYLDPASIAYEMHAYVVSNVYGNDPKEVEFQKTRMLRGLWMYFAVVEFPDDELNSDFSVLCMFWSMIIHFHRTGHCLPRSEASWSGKAYAYHRLLDSFANGGLSQAVANAPNGNKNVTVPSSVMSFVLSVNTMMSSQGAKPGTPSYERNRCHVDFVSPTIDVCIPEWYRAHDNLWTKTLQRFIETGVPPCQWFLKESGCKNRMNGRCANDHEYFVPLVNELMVVVRKPFSEQMKSRMSCEALGQGVAINPEELSNSGRLTKEEHQNQLKDKGNAFVQKQDYNSALLYYSEAIKVNPKVEAAAAIYSNRSLCHIHKADYSKALSDADECVSIRPSWFRGHFRRGYALEKLRRYKDAVAAFEKGISLDESQKKDVIDVIERCMLFIEASSPSNPSKSAKNEALKNLPMSAAKSKETVSAVFFPCDPDVRPYEVKIPSDIVANAHAVHSLLGITSEQISNLHNFWSKTVTRAPEGLLPPDVFEVAYGYKEWARDYKLKNGGNKDLPFAFQPKEICRGENDKSNLVALINPQSTDRPNLRMCAMLTPIDDLNNTTDANPASCKCRGDALVIRLRRSPLEDAPYFKDRRAMAWEAVTKTLNKLGTVAYEQYEHGPSFDPNVNVGMYVEIAAVFGELILNTMEHFAVDFTYDEYDKVWGFFAALELPLEAVLARGRGRGRGRGSNHQSVARGGGASSLRRNNNDDTESNKGPYYSTTLLPNTKASEKMYVDLMKNALNGRRK